MRIRSKQRLIKGRERKRRKNLRHPQNLKILILIQFATIIFMKVTGMKIIVYGVKRTTVKQNEMKIGLSVCHALAGHMKAAQDSKINAITVGSEILERR